MEYHGQEARPSRRRFRIWVAGRLDAQFIDGAEGIELGHSKDGSTLEGMFVDRSQLRGILDRLWQLGIEVIKFETYPSDPDAPQPAEHGDSPSPPSKASERYTDK